MPQEALRGLEKPVVRLNEAMNQTPGGRKLIAGWQRGAAGPFVRWVTKYRWELHHLERLRRVVPQRGTILVANHRSLFDMFVTLSVLFIEHGMYQNLLFPVRAPFFYTNPLGPVVCGLFSGFSMWPPVFRDERRSELNPIGVRQMLEALEEPGTCVGMHPEGARNKSDDPYSLLPARPGVGQMVQETHPETLIVPVFMHGLSNDFALEVRRKLNPRLGAEAPPIRWVFGEPIPAAELARIGDARTIANHLLDDRIRALAEEARRIDSGRSLVAAG
jgi:1-acyl-sn-glycerol-3-phosphate acyltransferase